MVLELRAHIGEWPLPQSPLGAHLIAYVPPGLHCIAIPDTLTTRVIAVDSNGRADTSYVGWGHTNPAGIALVGADSAALHGNPPPAQADSINQGIFPYSGYGPTIGVTQDFVPANSEGWETVFPNVPQILGPISARGRCD